jgi:hypothetical protein
MNIGGVHGVTEWQKATLRALGAVENVEGISVQTPIEIG